MHLIGTADIALQRDSRYSFVDLFLSQSNQPLEGTVSTFLSEFRGVLGDIDRLIKDRRIGLGNGELILHGCCRNQRVAGILGPDL